MPERAENIMGWWTQPYYEKGVAEGEASVARVLTRLLEKRFGVVPSTLRERIFAADVGQIEAWFDRAFDARDMDSILNPIDRSWQRPRRAPPSVIPLEG
jgi:hypothetical protein